MKSCIGEVYISAKYYTDRKYNPPEIFEGTALCCGRLQIPRACKQLLMKLFRDEVFISAYYIERNVIPSLLLIVLLE